MALSPDPRLPGSVELVRELLEEPLDGHPIVDYH